MRSLITTLPPSPFPFPSSLSGIVRSPNCFRATSYPHSRNPPSVNFMMLPLCTRDRGAPRVDRVLNRLRHQPLRAELRHRLDADRAAGADLRVVALRQESDDRVRSVASSLVLDARIDVLDVLAEDHDVELAGLLHGGRDPLEVAYGPDAGVQVEHLAQRDVERADPAADGRRQRPLDRDPVRPDRVKRRLRKPAIRGF